MTGKGERVCLNVELADDPVWCKPPLHSILCPLGERWQAIDEAKAALARMKADKRTPEQWAADMAEAFAAADELDARAVRAGDSLEAGK